MKKWVDYGFLNGICVNFITNSCGENGKNDEVVLDVVADIVRVSCMKHGFFIVSDHGVDQNLINDTYREFDNIFKLPLFTKVGSMRYPWGYLGSHAWRSSSNLPWKESFTFQYKHYDESNSQIVESFKSILGDDHQQAR